MANPENIVPKGEFAQICNVSPGRVTQWIAEKKLSGAALVGEGRSARIVVSVAQQQLRTRIDSGQAFGNGLNTRLRAPTASTSDAPAPTLPPLGEPGGDQVLDPAGLAADALDEQIKRERLEAIQRTNRIAAEEEAAAQGRLTDSAAARRQLITIAGQTLRISASAKVRLAGSPVRENVSTPAA